MPLEIRTRINTDYRLRDPSNHDGVDPASFIREAALFEADGAHSVYVPQMSTWADVWTVSAWLLSVTERLRVAVAHRVGVQSPTSAARALATLDRLSGGRAVIHTLTGLSDADVQRDGDFLSKQDRYRRADEYLEIFRRWLSAEEPFDFDGEFYRVVGAERAIHPIQKPHPTISYGGSSDESIALAARHADVFAMLAEPLAGTSDLIDRVTRAAADQGRSMRFWQNTNHILGRTDGEARDRAQTTYDQRLDELKSQKQSSGARLEAVMQQRVLAAAGEDDWHDKALFTGITRLSGGVVTPALVGSPETVADALLDYYDLGVEIFGSLYIFLSADALRHHEADRALRRELFGYLRDGARERDRVRASVAK